ncbi:MAG: hypothetical protein PVG20_08000, partial [Thioalkalispiraceae bacterium]
MQAQQTTRHSLSYNAIPMTSGLLLFLDFVSLLLAVSLSVFLYEHWQTQQAQSIYASYVIQVALIAAISAPFFLYNRRYGAIARRGKIGHLLRSHFTRFMLFASFILVLQSLIPSLVKFPFNALLIWMTMALVLTSVTRLTIAYTVRRFRQRGALTEVVAIVGAGPVADRTVQALEQNQGDTVEVLGVFDDKVLNAPASTVKSVGTIEQLLELGKSRKIDWILLTLPATAERRVLEIIQRL